MVGGGEGGPERHPLVKGLTWEESRFGGIEYEGVTDGVEPQACLVDGGGPRHRAGWDRR